MDEKNTMAFVAVGEASKRLGVCIDTIRKWMRDGKIKGYKTLSGHRRVSVADIDKIIKKEGAGI